MYNTRIVWSVALSCTSLYSNTDTAGFLRDARKLCFFVLGDILRIFCLLSLKGVFPVASQSFRNELEVLVMKRTLVGSAFPFNGSYVLQIQNSRGPNVGT